MTYWSRKKKTSITNIRRKDSLFVMTKCIEDRYTKPHQNLTPHHIVLNNIQWMTQQRQRRVHCV